MESNHVPGPSLRTCEFPFKLYSDDEEKLFISPRGQIAQMQEQSEDSFDNVCNKVGKNYLASASVNRQKLDNTDQHFIAVNVDKTS